MKKAVKILILTLSVIFVLSAFVGCAKNDTPDGFQLIARDGDTFRLYVPTQGWMPNTSGGITSAYYSVANKATGSPAASVSVYIPDDAKDAKSAPEYWTVCEGKLKSELEAYTLVSLEEDKINFGGQKGSKYVYTGQQTVNGKKITFKYMQVMAMYEGEIYVLLFSAPEKEYESRLEDIEGNTEHIGVIGNFKFAPPYESEDEKKFSDKETAPEGMKLASSKERPYILFCPNDWKIDTSADITTVYTDDKSNVTVQYTMPENSQYNSEKYFDECIKKYEAVMTEFESISKEVKKLGGAANSVVGTFSGKSGGVTYNFKQSVMLKGEVYYVVTYTATAENYDKHIADFDKMLENFSLK